MADKTLSAADLPRLVVHLPDGKEIYHSVVGSEIGIGRDPSNRITISDHFVSKFHAKLLVSESSMTLVDLESANKTYVNGRQIRESPVKYGDELRFAGVRCRLLPPESSERARPAAPMPAPPVPRVEVEKPPAARATAAAPPAVAPRAQRVKPTPKPARAPGRSAPPPIEADPMKRLLRIGGLLILVSAALAVMLRVLLVPSAEPTTAESSTETASPVTTTAAGAEAIPTTTAPPPPPATASGRDRESAQHHFDQALSYLDTGRLKEAQLSFRKVLEIDPTNARASTRLSLLEEEIARKAEQHFGNARQAFQFLRYDEAIAEWEMFLTLADRSDVRYAEAEQGIEQAKARLR